MFCSSGPYSDAGQNANLKFSSGVLSGEKTLRCFWSKSMKSRINMKPCNTVELAVKSRLNQNLTLKVGEVDTARSASNWLELRFCMSQTALLFSSESFRLLCNTLLNVSDKMMERQIIFDSRKVLYLLLSYPERDGALNEMKGGFSWIAILRRWASFKMQLLRWCAVGGLIFTSNENRLLLQHKMIAKHNAKIPGTEYFSAKRENQTGMPCQMCKALIKYVPDFSKKRNLFCFTDKLFGHECLSNESVALKSQKKKDTCPF